MIPLVWQWITFTVFCWANLYLNLAGIFCRRWSNDGSQDKRVQSNSERWKDRLGGLQLVVEDWHAQVCLLGVMNLILLIILLVNVGDLEKAIIIIQMLIIYGWRHTISVAEFDQPKECFKNTQLIVRTFFLHVLEAHIVTLCMTVFDMATIEYKPSTFYFQKHLITTLWSYDVQWTKSGTGL